MTAEVPKTGFVEVDEGRLFWKYDSPSYDNDGAKSALRPRPVLLFIHAYVFLASMPPASDQSLSLKTCLGIIYPVDRIQGSMDSSK